MVPVLESAKIPLDPYYAAAMLATSRALIAILGSSVANRLTKRTALIGCDIIMATGTFIFATYHYFNQDGSLTSSFPYASWTPIIAILLMYLAFSCGIGSVPYALQVRLRDAFPENCC